MARAVLRVAAMACWLALSPDARRVAIATDRIRLVTLEDRREVELAGEQVVAFDHAAWTVDAAGVLRRFAYDGHELGEAILPPGGKLARARYGAPFAVWIGREPLQLVERDGAVHIEALGLDAIDGRGDALVAVSAHRFVRLRGGEVAGLDRGGVRWRFDAGGGCRAIAAAPLLEGRAIAAMVAARTPQDRELVVLDARDGRVQSRMALRGVTGATFAALRGLAVLRAVDRLIVVDLRFGKILRQRESAAGIADVAIDDAGQRLVVLDAAGELTVLPVADVIAGRGAPAGPREPAHGDAPSNGAPAAIPVRWREVHDRPREPAAAPAPRAPLVVPSLLALRPVHDRPACTPAERTAWLGALRELVAATAARAIAAGWDSGTIGFVDETRPPFEKEVAALVLGVRGLAAPQRRKTEERVREATARLRALKAGLAGRETPLDRLAREHELDERARRLLALVTAPALWGELARLYGILANDERRALCDELLLVQLCELDAREAIASALDRDAPLIRHGLIHDRGDRERPFAALAVDPLVLRILRGEPLDRDLDRGLELAPPAPPLDELIAPRDALQHAIDALARAHPQAPLRLVIRGRTGSGRRTVASALASQAGRRAGLVDGTPLVRERRFGELAALLARTALRGWLPVLDVEPAADDHHELLAVLRAHPGPLAIRLARDATLRIPGAVELALPALPIGELADCWRARLAAAGRRDDDADALAARFHVGPGMIERCLASHAELGGTMEDAMRRLLASRLGEVATRVDRLPTWSQVVLPDDIEDSVLELIARLRHRRTVFDTWGFDVVASTSRGVTALFQGPPGTGKTLVAGAIANELGLDLYRVDLARVLSKWIGETEQNLGKVFAAAEDSQAILLFDEADSLFAKRTEVKSSNDRYANTEVNYLLQRLDSFEGIAILTTNFGAAIDRAFKRRLSFRLTFPFPDDDTRERLWRAHLPARLPRAGALDLGGLARRFRMSGGYIRNAALRAAFLAAEERSPLTQDHLERAIRAEFREIGNLSDSGVLA